MTTEFATPQTRYAESDGLSIAYQVFGSGAQDLLIIPGIVSHLDADWEDENHARMWRTLAQTFRVIAFDKRGQGLSDSFEGAPTLEQRMDDVRAVMHAVGSTRAILFALSEGGAMGALFTATYPDMVSQLVLCGALVRFSGSDDFAFSPTLDQHLRAVAKSWGTPLSARGFVPSRANDTAYCERFARAQRMAASPGAVKRLIMANDQIDVRAILPQIRRPTLVFQRRGDRIATCAHGRYFADHIPDAVYAEHPGVDHLSWEGDAFAIVDALRHFVHADHAALSSDSDGRFLATVLFTDIVGSTEHLARLGDQAWSDLLQKFHALCRAQLETHRGRLVDTAGDGLFAIFDGPARAIRCAAAMGAQAHDIGLELRAGLHTGEVETTGDKVSGMAVHIGARVMAQAGAGEVLVSSTVKDLVAGSGIGFAAHGTHSLKGVPGAWPLHRAL